MSKQVVVIDSGGANLGSVLYALQRLGVRAQLSRKAEAIASADRVILPGVGAAGAAMTALHDADLVRVIRQLEQPVLGICLGLQLLYDGSDEGDARCLGLLPGQVQRLSVPDTLRLPHMGWNQLQWCQDDPLAEGLSAQDWFYFVHSYAAPADHPNTVARSVHGQAFAAVVRQRNFAACQFHPEKSAAAGARLLANFVYQAPLAACA